MPRAISAADYGGASFAAFGTVAKPTVYADTLSRAALAIGGETRLAAALEVPLRDLQSWLHGEVRPSTEIYHKALDVLIGIGRN